MNAQSDADNPGSGPTEPSITASDRRISINGNRVDSRELFRSTREIIIEHRGEIYRLRLTAQNKLILTK
jgi:hemin uptake protein HemP